MNKARKTSPLLKILNNSLIDLPTPSSISLWWNMGSLLSACLMTQIITGLILSMYFTSNTEMAFNSIMHVCTNVNNGWLMRNIHANGASMFFVLLYMHIGRGVYYSLFKSTMTWMIGMMLIMLSMMTAFMGYVLPWGQMSFWGATVITNLFSSIPYMGNEITKWIWGGFSINNAILTRLFILHLTIPMIMSALVTIHILSLHQNGSNNPLGLSPSLDKIPFHPYFTSKDMMSMLIVISMLIMIALTQLHALTDPENFIHANHLVTPTHIQPEWYFLFSYTILRSVPNKLGGVLGMLSSITIIMILPLTNKNKFQNTSMYPVNITMFWMWVGVTSGLAWMGTQPAEEPFMLTSQMMTSLFFGYFVINPLMLKKWDSWTE